MTKELVRMLGVCVGQDSGWWGDNSGCVVLRVGT
jgi:hypothetical protein